MSGLNEFLWRANIPWPELVSAAEAVIGRWNTVTDFITHTDRREHIWTVRHASVGQPFIVLNADALRGSVPRIGNPMPLLLLIGICRQRPGALNLSFANGQAIDPARFDPADLTALLPHATHIAHRKLAEMLMQLPVPAAPPASKTG